MTEEINNNLNDNNKEEFPSSSESKSLPSEPSDVSAVKESPLGKLYMELCDVAKATLNKNIDRERIIQIVSRTVDAFNQDPYNDLLLYFYNVTKEDYIVGHIANSVILAVGFGTNLGVSREDLMDLGICAFCHDIGMAEYKHLFQKPHQLTEEENRAVQEHPSKSVEIFKTIFSEKIISGILDVHEYVNGQGYPKNKTGSEISFLAKIVSVCDVFTALTHQRSFRNEFNPYEAIKMIIKKKNSIFDGRVINKFVEFMSIYPIGCLVYLNTGETAMVIASNKGFPTRAIVRVLLTAKREIDRTGRVVNLLEDNMLYINGVVGKDEEKEILRVIKPRGDFE